MVSKPTQLNTDIEITDMAQEDLIYPVVFSPREGWTYSVGMDWIGHLVFQSLSCVDAH
jgi:hypothetical protein